MMHLIRLIFLGLLVMGELAFAAGPPPSIAVPGTDTSVWKRNPPFEAPKVATGGFNGQAYLDQLDPELRKQLLEERVVLLPEVSASEGKGVAGLIRIVTIFEAPAEKVLQKMFATGDLDQILSGLDDSETIARIDNVGELTKMHIDVLWWDIDFWIQHWFYPEQMRYEWQLDKIHFENDIEGNWGYWQLYPLNERQVIAESGQNLDTGFPIPKGMYERILKRQIPKTVWEYKDFMDEKNNLRALD